MRNLSNLVLFLLISPLLIFPAKAVELGMLPDRTQAIRDYLSRNRAGWDWFMYRPHGFQGLPVIFLKSMPLLAPEIWGPPKEKFARFGHFVLPADDTRVLPSSLAISPSIKGQLTITTLSCGTCHTGRVRVSNHEVFLYGGVNNQFDNRRWRDAFERTINDYLGNGPAIRETAGKLIAIIREQPPGTFLRDGRAEREERAIFERDAEKILTGIALNGSKLIERTKKQLAGPYGKANSPDIRGGNPGQVDASGDTQAGALPPEKMPQWASPADIPAVWAQFERNTGQWDGSVEDPFFRNLAAQMAVVAPETVDIRVAAHAVPFTQQLPSPSFPFAIQRDRLARGRALFEKNCKVCHFPQNKGFYSSMETDSNRAKILTPAGFQLIKIIFRIACPQGKLIEGFTESPCDKDLNLVLPRDTSLEKNQGYVATPLTGVWATAPYLHNGSVPTLYHLLLPRKERPPTFVRGALDYDAELGGYAWRAKDFDRLKEKDRYAVIVDTSKDGLSNTGHDRDILLPDGQTAKLDWSAPAEEENRKDLIEYVKTL